MRLAASLRHALYGTMGLLLASGLAWLAVRAGSTATWSMRIHGATAMALLALGGGAVALHVKDAWRERKNRLSGLALAGTLLVLAVTGYLLYYVGDDEARGLVSALHWILGIAAAAVLAWHALVAQRLSGARVD